MASYATIPAEAEAEKPLLNRDLRVNLKTVIGGAAVASFVLGALAAAVVSGAPARTNSAALYAHSGYQLNAQTPMAFSSGLLKDGAHCKGDNFCASGDCHKGHQDQKYWKCKESHSHKYDDINKHCTRDSDCGGNAPHCHKHHTVIDGVNLYHKCKPHSDTYYMPSPTRKPTPSPPTPAPKPTIYDPNVDKCGVDCKTDADCKSYRKDRFPHESYCDYCTPEGYCEHDGKN